MAAVPLSTSTRLLGVAAIAIPSALLVLAGWLNWRQLEDDAHRTTTQTAGMLAEHAHRTFRAHELILQLVDSHVRDWSWRDIHETEGLHQLLARLRSGNRDVSSVFLVDPSGRTAASSRTFRMPSIDASDRDYFRALVEHDELYVSAPARGRLANDLFFSLARRRSAGSGQFDGVIAVSVDPVYFSGFYASLLYPGEAASLIRADGTLLVRHPDAALAVVPPQSGLMRALATDRFQGSYVTRSLADDTRRLVAYRRVGEYPLYATFSYSMSAVWANWRQAMLPYLLASLLASAGLLAVASLAAQRGRHLLAEQRRRDAEEASAAKDRFVAAVSHELRSPLSAIATASEVLARSAYVDNTARSAADIISRQVDHARAILDDLLDTARAMYGKLRLEKRPLDLHALAAEVIADRRHRTALTAALSLAGQSAWVSADPVRVRQMLDNLLENAVRYGGRHVKVTVGTVGGHAELEVADDGDGIPAELVARLFQPFAQGEAAPGRPHGGLGLGLALVDRLARLHDGSVSVASEGAGSGSTFTLRFPRIDPPAGAPRREAA